MPRIPVLQATCPDELPKAEDVERRLKDFLQALRQSDYSDERPDPFHALLTRDERMRIHRRARTFCNRARAATGLAHLSKEAREQIAVLRDGAAILAIPSEHRADEVARHA